GHADGEDAVTAEVVEEDVVVHPGVLPDLEHVVRDLLRGGAVLAGDGLLRVLRRLAGARVGVGDDAALPLRGDGVGEDVGAGHDAGEAVSPVGEALVGAGCAAAVARAVLTYACVHGSAYGGREDLVGVGRRRLGGRGHDRARRGHGGR